MSLTITNSSQKKNFFFSKEVKKNFFKIFIPPTGDKNFFLGGGVLAQIDLFLSFTERTAFWTHWKVLREYANKFGRIADALFTNW